MTLEVNITVADGWVELTGAAAPVLVQNQGSMNVKIAQGTEPTDTVGHVLYSVGSDNPSSITYTELSGSLWVMAVGGDGKVVY